MPFFPLRRVLALTLAAAAFCCAPAAPAQTLPDTQVGTQAVSGGPDVSALLLAPEAQPAPDAVLHLSLALKSSRMSGAEAFAASLQDPHSLNYHHPLTPEQFGERFGASDADIAAVTAWAQAHGMIVHVWPNKLFVSAQSTVGGAESAFGVRIIGFRRAKTDALTALSPTFYAPDRAPRLPTDIAGRVKSIFGLDTFLVARPGAHLRDGANDRILNAMVPRAAARFSSAPAAPNAKGGGALPVHPPTVGSATPAFSSAMTPSNVSTFYEFDPLHTAGFNGQGQTIAVFSPSGFNTSDLAAFANAYGRTGYTLNVVNVDGGNSNLGGQLEPALDTEVIIGQARYATINMYEEPNSGNGFIDGFNKIASDNPPVVTSSWSYDEHYLHSNGFDSFFDSMHSIFVQMNSQGMSVFNDTGDGGATVGTDGTNVAYPASDPDVTAVGGTDNLTDSSSSYVSETGWTGSGGGRSVYFALPSYQSGPGVSNSYSNGMRQIPDVAADGGPTPGYVVYVGGHYGGAYGTSASTPLWATATVLINQGANSLGFGSRSYNLNPFLYYLGTRLNGYNNAEVFHDITSGSNGYPTTGQWDFVTGWGSARFTKLYYDDVYRPDFVPLNPYGGWIAPILVSTSSTSAAEPTYFNNLTNYSFGYAFQNAGPADGNYETSRLSIDGTNYDLYNADLPVGYYFARFPVYTGTLALGPHTLTMTADVNNDVAENNESNNSYTRTITVRPYNDPFTMPFFIYGGSGNYSATNSYATAESGEPNHGGRTPSASVWWYWTCPGTRTYVFNTEGSNYDTTMGVYTGSAVNGLTTLGESDDVNGAADRTSSVSFLATAGAAYRIAVDGYNGATGNISLNWNTAAPLNDNFAAAHAISGASGSLTDSNLSATKETGEPAHGGNSGGASIWYAWTAPYTGKWTFATEGSNFDTTMGVYTGSAVGALTTIGESDDVNGAADRTSSVTFSVTAGTVYYIAVDGYNGVGGTVVLSWANVLTPSALSFSPSTVVGGSANTTGTVTLNSAAPSGGSVVSLTSSNSSALTFSASTVTVAAGATTATFRAYSHKVTSTQTVTVTATLNGTGKTATVKVTPVTAAALSSLSFNPTTVVGGSANTTGTVTLTANAPSGGAVVSLSSSTSAMTFAASTVTVPAGSTSATFRAYSHTVTSTVTATVTAKYNSVSKTATVKVTPAAVSLSSLSFSPSSVKGGSANTTGTVTLTGAAPSGGLIVSLSSSNAAITFPASTVTVPAGATNATFRAYSHTVSATQTVTVTAKLGSVSKTATITVTH